MNKVLGGHMLEELSHATTRCLVALELHLEMEK